MRQVGAESDHYVQIKTSSETTSRLKKISKQSHTRIDENFFRAANVAWKIHSNSSIRNNKFDEQVWWTGDVVRCMHNTTYAFCKTKNQKLVSLNDKTIFNHKFSIHNNYLGFGERK